MKLLWGVWSIQGKKNRPNEDRYRVRHAGIKLVERAERGEVFAVFDGIGGVPRGMAAAQEMCDALIELFKPEFIGDAEVDVMQHLLVDANLRIKAWGCMPGTTRPLGGCAGTIAWYYRGRLTLFHAGDTVGYQLRDGLLTSLTMAHGTGNFIDNYFGLGIKLRIDVFALEPEEGDVLVLVTDGATKGLSSPEIETCVARGIMRSPEWAAKELCELARRKGSNDDITALVVELEEFGPRERSLQCGPVSPGVGRRCSS